MKELLDRLIALLEEEELDLQDSETVEKMIQLYRVLGRHLIVAGSGEELTRRYHELGEYLASLRGRGEDG